MSQSIPEKQRCQSCGMPLGLGFFGRNTDGTENQDFCKMCWQGDNFIEPDLTSDQMVERSIYHMITVLHFAPEKAQQLAQSLIPTLKRWQDA